MCGILFVASHRSDSSHLYQRAKEALHLPGMYNRGPDTQLAIKVSDTFILGHNRLAIQDLSAAGVQPMSSEGNRSILVFNGEIYNANQLRKHWLPNHVLKGTSDTEILLLLLEVYGVDFTLSKIEGDFAFVFLDIQASVFHIARDHFGSKPLYIYSDEDHICVASRVEAIHHCLQIKPQPDYDTIGEFLHSSSGGESSYSWFRSVKRVDPGVYIRGSIQDDEFCLAEKQYWSSRSNSSSSASRFPSFTECFDEQVSNRLVGDVEISVALSGGLDSTSIFLAANKHLAESPQCITYVASNREIEGEDSVYYTKEQSLSSEEINASALTSIFNAPLRVATDDDENFVSDLCKCIYSLESGHTSTSLVPALKLYELASRHSKVVIEGQGADELVCGYIMKSYPYMGLYLLSRLKIIRFLRLSSFVFSTYSVRSVLNGFLRDLRFTLLNRIYSHWSGLASIIPFKKPRSNSFSCRFTEILKNPLLFHIKRCQRLGLCNLLQYGDALALRFSLENRNPYISQSLSHHLYSSDLSEIVPSSASKPLIRNIIRSYSGKVKTLPSVKLGFPNQTARHFQDINSPAIQILLSDRTLSRPFWDGAYIKKYVDAYLGVKSDCKHWYNIFSIHPSYNHLYKILLVELWHRIFIDP